MNSVPPPGPHERPTHGWSSAAVLGALIALFSVALYGGLVGDTTASWLADAAWTLFSLAACWRSWRTARAARTARQRRAWAFFAAAAGSWFVGMLWLVGLELTRAEEFVPFPTPANYFFAGFAPLFLAGMYYFRATRPSRETSHKQLAEIGVLTTALAVALVVALLEPLLASSESFSFRFFSLVDPLAFGVALAFTLTALWRHEIAGRRPVYLLLLGAVALHTAADLLYFASELGYSLGLAESLEATWLVAFALQYLAAERHELGAEADAREGRRLESGLSKAAIPAVLVFLILLSLYAFSDHLTDRTFHVVAPLFALFACFLGWRQWASDRLEARLFGELETTAAELEVKVAERDAELRERHRAEQALRASRLRFKDFADTAADWFWEIDDELRIRFLSERYEEVTGTPAGDHLGQPMAEILARHSPDPADAARLAAHLTTGRAFEQVISWQSAERSHRILSLSGKPIFATGGEVRGYRGSGRDITRARVLSERLSYEASHDSLTGLYNRRELEQRIQRLLRRSGGSDEHAFLYLDLDQFKVINDTCGHVAGDELLRQIGRLLQRQVRRHDVVARLGGDEFGLLLEHCSGDDSRRMAEALLDSLAEFRFSWEEHSFSVGASVGLVPLGAGATGLSEVMAGADAACYAAKDRGGHRVHVYDAEDAEMARRRGEMRWVSRIHRALDEGSLKLYYQPIAPVAASGKGLHYELLLRMLEPDGNRIAPGTFLPAAERFGLSATLDRWVVESALAQLARSPAHLEDLYLCCINLSGLSVGDDGFVDDLVRVFKATGVPARKICFEITETAAIANLAGASHLIAELGRLGCRFALDDFGSGLSSFAYLKTLPVDYLKIDGLFVRDMVEDPTDRAMVRSIHEIGRVMGKRTIAEFVETDAVLENLRELGVDYAQGFAISRPRPFEELLAVVDPAAADARAPAP